MVASVFFIPGGIHQGDFIRFKGCATKLAHRFDLNLQSGQDIDSPNIPFHFSVRFAEGRVACNSRKQFGWERELGNGPMPLYKGKPFDILVRVEQDGYIVEVDQEIFCRFPNRAYITTIDYIQVSGDISYMIVEHEHSPTKKNCLGQFKI
ncbi:hypothetical protein GWI33_007744 [Rhynchophorus ferrugineus]|uniref:Galectin n=1 Tax=Rhynchophorus ferrugineus TaxID=354439 RepID=A0A834MML5_RHYFE|nr:hypothetical protein GWI33_007744 [Rhynchophorus ferrugineus]